MRSPFPYCSFAPLFLRIDCLKKDIKLLPHREQEKKKKLDTESNKK